MRHGTLSSRTLLCDHHKRRIGARLTRQILCIHHKCMLEILSRRESFCIHHKCTLEILSRRECLQVNGHDEWSQVILWIEPFPGEWPSILPVSKCVARAVTIDQPRGNVQEMIPYFILATLVSRLDSKDIMINIECAVHADMPFGFGSWWLDKATYDSHSPGTPPGHHNCVGPCGIGKFVFANASSIVLSRRWSLIHFCRHASPLKSRSHQTLRCATSLIKPTVLRIPLPL